MVYCQHNQGTLHCCIKAALYQTRRGRSPDIPTNPLLQNCLTSPFCERSRPFEYPLLQQQDQSLLVPEVAYFSPSITI
jgi:hypothetical protein